MSFSIIRFGTSRQGSQQTCRYLWVLESDEIVFTRMKTEDVDTAIPNKAFLYYCGMECKMLVSDDMYPVQLTLGRIIIFLFCVKNDFYSIRNEVDETLRYLGVVSINFSKSYKCRLMRSVLGFLR